MPLRPHPTKSATCVLAILALLVSFEGVSAQSSSYAAVSGTVRDGLGGPLGQAIVTLTSMGGTVESETTTSGSGAFSLRLVPPGRYELRVEALGYRPLVARVLSLSGGDQRSLDLTLVVDPPPVEMVDTLALPAGAGGQNRAEGVRLGEGGPLRSLPYRWRDVGALVAFSSSFDASLGSQGLPSDHTLVLADGVPVYRAPHPVYREEPLPAPLFPLSTLGSVSVATDPGGVEWSGAPGGMVSLSSATSAATDLSLAGGYSGGPLWSSAELGVNDASPTSYDGSLRLSRTLEGGTTLAGVADVLSHQTPMRGRVPESVAAGLTTLDPSLLSELTEPGLETYSRYSGLFRATLRSGPTSGAFVRAGGGYSRRTFEGAGPVDVLDPRALDEESIDLSLAGGYVSSLGLRTTIELIGGFSGSFRDFHEHHLDLPPGYLTGSATALASPVASAGESSRTDIVLAPVLTLDRDGGAWKVGATVRVSDHLVGRSSPSPELVYGDPTALDAGEGLFRSEVAPSVSFKTQEYGLLAQYEGELGSGFRIRVGGRFDLEVISADDLTLNTDWFSTTGLSNDSYPSSLAQAGFGGRLIWEPAGSPGTQLFLAGSMRHGDLDPRAIGEAVYRSTEAVSTVAVGSGAEWPAGTSPAGANALPTITLLGPDTRAPRTIGMRVGLSQQLSPATTVFVEGATRRTDFLLRRRNLNLPLVPQAMGPDGRDVFGTLQQTGSLVTATGDDARRFPEFGPVWARDPDGWSEYRGVTVGVETSLTTVDVHASYTYSETTDNWVGAAAGPDGYEFVHGGGASATAGEWSEGTSDFDVPHRLVAGVVGRLGPVEISGLYRYRSGRPFTPGFRLGVDANGDGSIRNDVPFVPDATDLAAISGEWPCLTDQSGSFAARNSCRGSAEHSVNAGLRARLGEVGGRVVHLDVDALNLVEFSGGLVDTALMLVDPTGTITVSPDGSTVTLPLLVNPQFGSVVYPASRGRMIRIGVRVGG